MRTLTIASEGYLKCGNPLQIAVDGYLDNCGDIVPPITPPKPIIPGTGGNVGVGKVKKTFKPKDWDYQKIREDEEILVIIKAFVQCQ